LALAAGQLTVSWWRPLADATFWLVSWLLSLVSADVVCEPGDFVIGISNYTVEIGAACAGYEGIGLVCAFLAAYLWFARRTLRFPQALLLLPLGTIVIWLTNAVRIAALVMIGAWWSPDVAGGGFHSQAGWLAFIAVSLGLVVVSHRCGFFQRDQGRVTATRRNPAAPYLVPFVVLMAALMVGNALSAGFDYLYPVRVVAAVAALWWYRRDYVRIGWSWSWPAFANGAVVFVVWIGLETMHSSPGNTVLFAQAIDDMPPIWAAAWLGFRVLGSVLTVPLVEELAFRGYLIRRLQKAEFQDVPQRSFTWFSFLASSLLFGLLHDRWLAGTLAGMSFAIALYRRGNLADAILAHATANALLAAYVLATQDWSFWI
jgi:exosortase E/protease (VPEID-CTERM system)